MLQLLKLYLKFFPSVYSLNKKIFKKNILLFIVLLLLYTIIDSRVLNIDFVNAYDVDEFYFLKILYSRQFYGFNHLDAQKFFSGFYSYGRLFWIVNFIATYIPFCFKNFSAALFIARLVTSLFAVQGFLIFKEILSKLIVEKLFYKFVFIVSLLMIYGWAVGSWLHPDWMMMYFIIVSFYYYFDKEEVNKLSEIFFLISFAIAFAVKVQTLQLLPLVFLLSFRNFFTVFSISAFVSSAKGFLISLVIILIVFVLLNPYLLNPAGTHVFIESFATDMQSNKTNQWNSHLPQFHEKVISYTQSYLSGEVMMLSLICTLAFVVFNIKKINSSYKKLSFLISLIIIVLYYSFFVNKTWPHYYLPIPFMVLIVLCFSIASLNIHSYLKITIASLALIFQIANFVISFSFFKDWIKPQRILAVNNSYRMLDSINYFLKEHPDSKSSAVLFSFNIPVPVNSAGLNFSKISPILEVDEKHLEGISRLDKDKAKYIIIEKRMFFKDGYKSVGPLQDGSASKLISIMKGQSRTFSVIGNDQYFLYIRNNSVH